VFARPGRAIAIAVAVGGERYSVETVTKEWMLCLSRRGAASCFGHHVGVGFYRNKHRCYLPAQTSIPISQKNGLGIAVWTRTDGATGF
jgi:hypothetical protein